MAVISREVLEIRVDGLQGVSRAYVKVADLQKQLGRSTNRTDKTMAQSGQAMKGFRAGLANLANGYHAVQAAAAVARRAIAAVKAPADLAINFEKQFAAVTTLLDGSGESFGKLKKELLDLARTVPQTADDITKSAYQAISAGIPESEVASFLATASKTAVAAGSTMTEAVDVLTASVNAFKDQGLTANKASDILFKTVKNGVTTVQELQQNMGKATGLAQFGVTFEEINAAVAQMTKLGTPTSEAFTKVVAVVKTLAAQSGPAAKKLKALGVETGVSALQSKGLSGVLAEVQEKTGGSAAIIGTLTRRFEAVDGMLKLMGPNFKQFNGILDANRKSAGATNDAYGKMSKTTDAAIQQWNALKEDVLRRLGENMLPMIMDGLTRMSSFLETNGQSIIDALSGALETLFSFGMWIVENGPQVVTLVTAMFGAKMIAMFVAAVQSATAAMVAHSAVAGATMAQSMVAGLAGFMAGPAMIGLAVGGAIILGRAIGGAIQDAAGDGVRAMAKHAFDQAVETAAQIKTILSKAGTTRAGINQKIKDTAEGKRFGYADAGGKSVVKELRFDRIDKMKAEYARLEMTNFKGVSSDDVKAYAESIARLEGRAAAALAKMPAAGKNLRTGSEFLQQEAELIMVADKSISRPDAGKLAYKKLRETHATDVKIVQQERQDFIDRISVETKQAEKRLGKSTAAYESALAADRALQAQGEADSPALQAAKRDLKAAQSHAADKQKQFQEKKRASVFYQRTLRHEANLDAELARLDPARLERIKPKLKIVRKPGGGGKGKGKGKSAAQVAAEAFEQFQEQYAKRSIERANRQERRQLGLPWALSDKGLRVLKDNVDRAAFLTAVQSAQENDQPKVVQRIIDMNTRLVDVYDKEIDKVNERQKAERKLYREKIAAADLDRSMMNAMTVAHETEIKFLQKEAGLYRGRQNKRQTELDEIIALEQRARVLRASASLKDQKRGESLVAQAAARSEKATLGEGGATQAQKDDAEKARNAEESARVRQQNEETERIQGEFNVRMMEAKDQGFALGVHNLQQTHEAELELYRQHGINVVELQEIQNQEIGRLRFQQGAQMVGQYASEAAAVTGSISNIMSSYQSLSAARMRTAQTDLKAGKMTQAEFDQQAKRAGEIEANIIIAKGVQSGFMSLYEGAQAMSSFATGTPMGIAKGLAHLAAAAAHGANAAMAPEMAEHARTASRAGISGGGGAGGATAGVQSSNDYMKKAEMTEGESGGPAIQFGDIILADMPHLFADTDAFGRHVAGSIVEEINRQGGNSGGFRISRRAQRGR